MEVTVQLPNDLATHADPAREALEAVTIAGYRSGQLSHAQARKLLGLTRIEFDGYLKTRNITEHAYDVEDLENDLRTLSKLEDEPESK